MANGLEKFLPAQNVTAAAKGFVMDQRQPLQQAVIRAVAAIAEDTRAANGDIVDINQFFIGQLIGPRRAVGQITD